jgi:hypothetical protein
MPSGCLFHRHLCPYRSLRLKPPLPPLHHHHHGGRPKLLAAFNKTSPRRSRRPGNSGTQSMLLPSSRTKRCVCLAIPRLFTGRAAAEVLSLCQSILVTSLLFKGSGFPVPPQLSPAASVSSTMITNVECCPPQPHSPAARCRCLSQFSQWQAQCGGKSKVYVCKDFIHRKKAYEYKVSVCSDGCHSPT